MVKISHSVVLMVAVASEDGEAMLQVGKVGKHAPALAQTGSTVRASRQQQVLQMETNFEKLAAEAVRTGDTPSLGTDARSAVNAALDTLEQELENEKTANDALMVNANNQCSVCNTEREDAFTRSVDGVDALGSTVEETRKQHADCRTLEEDPQCVEEKTTCDDQDEYARKAHNAAPDCVCKNVDTVIAATQQVCLQGAVTWGEQYNTALGNKITDCDQAKQAAEEVAQECDDDQVTFEMAVCLYKESLTMTCESHGVCYAEALDNRETVMTELKLKEASEKIMWKSCQKVRCYLDMLDATKANQADYQADFDKCKIQEAETAHLDVVYPDAPPKEDCDTAPVSTVPGDSAWLKAEYATLAPKAGSWLPSRTGIEVVTPCTQQTSLVLPTQPTKLGENGGGILVPQPMIVEPQPMTRQGVTAAAGTHGVKIRNCDCKGCSPPEGEITHETTITWDGTEEQDEKCISLCTNTEGCKRMMLNNNGCHLYNKGAHSLREDHSLKRETCWVAAKDCQNSFSETCGEA